MLDPRQHSVTQYRVFPQLALLNQLDILPNLLAFRVDLLLPSSLRLVRHLLHDLYEILDRLRIDLVVYHTPFSHDEDGGV